ncbi:MAG TPA: toll/interleukin-1 receptor domain-containing protein [Solirubrobacterales bacterium]|nr:toll/interleukin-1 receptor domain-containing protein [Solirubrobacterales bacterium]
MANFAGFWSYVRDDNRNSGGRILSLADRLSEAFQLLSGEPLELFVDRDLQWGEEWERRIEEALQQTTFFIPVVTPSYFRHDACRKELMQFASAAKRFGVEQLLLPIYYVDVKELDRDDVPSDEAMAIIKRTQWADLRGVRLSDEASADHRAVVSQLAQRLFQVTEDIEAQPPLVAPEVSQVEESMLPVPGDDGPGPEEDGYLELLARGEAALPKWTETIKAIGAELQEFGRLTDESVAEIQADDASGRASFATRLAIANRFATKLERPAENLVELGSEYVSRLFEVDPAVRTIIRFAEEDEGARNAEGIRTLFEAIRTLTVASRESMEGAKELSRILEENAGFSRELKRPLRKIQGALRSMVDAQSMLDDWDDEIGGLMSPRPS